MKLKFTNKGPCCRRYIHLFLFLCVTSFIFRSKIGEEFASFFNVKRNENKLSIQQGTYMRPRNQSMTHLDSYEAALAQVSDADKFILVASVDFAYINMALNLYMSSILPFNITNFLLICSDKRATDVARAHGIPSVTVDRHDLDGNTSSRFGTNAFNRKSHVKTDLTLKALKLGYTVLLVDVDIVFLKNPIPFIQNNSCDIYIQSDTTGVNTGFYLVRPTKNTILLLTRAMQMAHKNPRLNDQNAISETLKQMNQTREISPKLLPDDIFPNGRVYFEQGGRMFAGDNTCSGCVLVHNNWILTQQAKTYRFKEHLLWWVDRDRYYSCPDRKYMVYNNPDNFGAKLTFSKEDAALRSAFSIAKILNRTLILPRFHCYKCWRECWDKARPLDSHISKPHCNLSVYYKIIQLDRSLQYRESVFLLHQLVPESVKLSVSPVLRIISSNNKVEAHQNVTNVFITKGKNGATKEEIIDWFACYSSVSVLRFRSLYGAFTRFETLGKFGRNLKEGLSSSNFRQHNAH